MWRGAQFECEQIRVPEEWREGSFLQAANERELARMKVRTNKRIYCNHGYHTQNATILIILWSVKTLSRIIYMLYIVQVDVLSLVRRGWAADRAWICLCKILVAVCALAWKRHWKWKARSEHKLVCCCNKKNHRMFWLRSVQRPYYLLFLQWQNNDALKAHTKRVHVCPCPSHTRDDGK